MARKLKTYQTSMGFFDLAIAAPSMKAALEAWGSGSNLFHQGLAKQVDDPEVVAVTMAKPGVVLKRPVGSSGAFKENAELPDDISGPGSAKARVTRSKLKSRHPKGDDKESRKASATYEREQRRRDRERQKEEAERDRRENAIAKAKSAIAAAERDHEGRTRQIEADRAAIEKRSQAEDSRWEKLKEKLDDALLRARR